MSEFKIESTTPDFEKDPQVHEWIEKNLDYIESLLEDIKTKLGEGKTADVHFLDSNTGLCVKVLKQPEEIPDVFYHRIDKEMAFLQELQGFDSKIKVPKPYLTADYDGMKCMLMQTIPGANIIDIVNGKGSLPENFNADTFYKDMADFIEKLHENNIYHRDLHAGNIMITPETGEVYVIDFGCSGKAYGDENPYQQRGLNRTFTFTRDEVNIKSAYQVLKKHILTSKK